MGCTENKKVKFEKPLFDREKGTLQFKNGKTRELPDFLRFRMITLPDKTTMLQEMDRSPILSPDTNSNLVSPFERKHKERPEVTIYVRR